MNQDHWESYYRSGALLSCPTNPEPYYTMEVREAWTGFFSALSDGARVLDLGTGNGPVALIAKETAVANSQRCNIDAIDLAQIDPPKFVPDGENLLSGISFHGGVSSEALPFESSSFDAISGQYIVEYTDIGMTLDECFRVLKPGGRCRFILHHLDSIVVANAVESLRQADLVLHETKTLRKFRRYCECAHDAPARSDSARDALMTAGKQLQDAARQSLNPLLLNFVIDTVSALLSRRSRLSSGQMLQQTQRLEKELKNWICRLQDLVAAALSSQELHTAVDTAAGVGFENIDSEIQWQAGDKLVGWRLTLSAPA